MPLDCNDLQSRMSHLQTLKREFDVAYRQAQVSRSTINIKKAKETKEQIETFIELFSQELVPFKITDELQKLFHKGVHKNYIAQGLIGVGTEASMKLRQQLIEAGVDKDHIALGLAGVGTEASMDMRRQLINEGIDLIYIAYGLSGVGTEASMKLRQQIIGAGMNKDAIVFGLSGVGTEASMIMRKQCIDLGVRKNRVVYGLAGIGTSDSMDMRAQFINERINKNDIAMGLSGIDTPESMDMRRRLSNEGIDLTYIALGLALCSPSVGPDYRIQHADQLFHEWRIIGMDPIDIIDGPCIFFMMYDKNGFQLDAYHASPDRIGDPDHSFIFCLHKVNP